MNKVEWFEIRGFYEEHGCVWVDQPEMRWYEESWGALMRTDLTDYDGSDDEVFVRLRVICLLYMYLGFCSCLDENREPYLIEMLEGLNIYPATLANIIGEEKLHKVPYDDFIETLESEATDLIQAECGTLYNCLKDHYGGESLLFVSLYNSFKPLYEVENPETILNSDFRAEKFKAFEYVQDGMSEW